MFIDFSVKTLVKRVEEAVQGLADFLNTSVFNTSGLDQHLKAFLCAADDQRPLLSDFLPNCFSGRVIPKSLKEAKMFPLGSNKYPELTLALGCLRSFDCSMNNAPPTHTLQCAFHPISGSQGPIIQGLNKLDKYGQLGFKIFYCVASSIGGEFLDVCNCTDPNDVASVMEITLSR